MIFLTRNKRIRLIKEISQSLLYACDEVYNKFGESDESGAIKDETAALRGIAIKQIERLKELDLF
jgi:hypothetical protein